MGKGSKIVVFIVVALILLIISTVIKESGGGGGWFVTAIGMAIYFMYQSMFNKDEKEAEDSDNSITLKK